MKKLLVLISLLAASSSFAFPQQYEKTFFEDGIVSFKNPRVTVAERVFYLGVTATNAYYFCVLQGYTTSEHALNRISKNSAGIFETNGEIVSLLSYSDKYYTEVYCHNGNINPRIEFDK